jgi:hypothetical protein
MFSFQTLKDSASAASRRVSSWRNIVNPKAEPKAPETVRRIPRKQFDAVMGGAKAVMRELSEFAEQAKRLRDDRPIVPEDLLELLRKLIATQKRINAEMEADIAKSADTSDTEWDRRRYNLFAVPTSRMANSPQAIVDITLAASNNGAKDFKLLYELTVAEMDVAVARFNVTLSLITGEGIRLGVIEPEQNLQTTA